MFGYKNLAHQLKRNRIFIFLTHKKGGVEIAALQKSKIQFRVETGFCGPTWARTMDPLIMSQVL